MTDFTKLIQDDVPRGAKTFYEKDDSERYALGLPFDNFKVSFPQAISGGQNIYNEFVFNKSFIPNTPCLPTLHSAASTAPLAKPSLFLAL